MMNLIEGFGSNFAYFCDHQSQIRTHTHGHVLLFLVQTGRMLALGSRSMEQALFAVRMIVNLDSSVWEVAMNSKRAFVVLEPTAARVRSLPDPV